MEKNARQLCRVHGADKKAHLGNVYIVSDNNSVATELNKVFGQSTAGMFYIPYVPVCISNICMLSDKALAETASSLGANVFTQVFMPDQDSPVFLFETGDNDSLGLTAINMIYVAEDLAKQSVCSAIRNYALNKPDKCQEWLLSSEEKDSHDSDKREKSLYEAIMFDRDNPMQPSFKGVSNYSADVSPRQAEMMKKYNDARSNFVKYVQEIKNGESSDAEEAEKMIDWVLKDISERQKNMALKLFLKEMNADDLEDFFYSFIDVSGIPYRSKIKLSVEEFNDCINNDGYYRLCYQYADSEKKAFHFKHKSACVVYLMLLVNRKKDKEMNTFFTFEKDNAEDKELFIKLMRMVYGKQNKDAALDYDNLFTDKDGVQGRLKDYIKSCKDIVDEAVGKYESPYPFMPKKLGTSGREFVLPILPENIALSDSFTEKFS